MRGHARLSHGMNSSASSLILLRNTTRLMVGQDHSIAHVRLAVFFVHPSDPETSNPFLNHRRNVGAEGRDRFSAAAFGRTDLRFRSMYHRLKLLVQSAYMSKIEKKIFRTRASRFILLDTAWEGSREVTMSIVRVRYQRKA